MKHIPYLLLPLLIASCTMTPVQSPYKAGTTFTLDGMTKDKQVVHRTITLRDDGKREGSHWLYSANGLSNSSALFSIETDYSIIVVIDSTNNLERYFTCVLLPDLSTTGWSKATGALISGSFDEMNKTMVDVSKNARGSAFLQGLKDAGGDCGLVS